MNKKLVKGAAAGVAVGVLNGLFGAGGGMVAVPMLKKAGLAQKNAHATSIAITMPLSVISGLLYLHGGRLALTDAMYFIPAGIVGAAIGGVLIKKLSVKTLRRCFGALIIFAAIRLMLK